MFFRIYSRALFSLSLILIISGCRGENLPQGQYRGTFFSNTQLGKTSTADSETSYKDQTYSQLVLDPQKGTLQFYIMTDELQKRFVAEFSVNSLQQTSVKLPELNGATLSLSRSRHEQYLLPSFNECLKAKEPYVVKVCWSNTDIYFHVQKNKDETLYFYLGGRYNEIPRKRSNTPIDLTINDAIELALKRNLNSQVEFQKLVQATGRARAAELNLLPRIRFFNVAGLAFMAPPVIMTSFGDWAPFLFPTRWIQRKIAGIQEKIQRQFFKIVRANLIFEVETQAYQIIEIQNKLAISDEIQAKLTEFNLRLFNNSSDDSVTDQMRLNILSRELELQRRIDMARLADLKARLALLTNLGSEKEIGQIRSSDFSSDLLSALPAEESQIESQSLAQSPELEQMKYYLDVSKQKRLELPFIGMDPTGDPSYSLGPALHAHFQVAKSVIKERELLLQESALQLASQARQYVRMYNGSLDRSKYLSATLSSQLELLRSLESESSIPADKRFITFQITQAMDQYFKTSRQYEEMLRSMRTGRAGIDRLTFKTYHKTLLTPEEPATEPDTGRTSCF